MGVLSNLKNSNSAVAEIPSKSNIPVPCPSCTCPIFWTSVYNDGILRCQNCEPPPAPAMISSRAVVTIDENQNQTWQRYEQARATQMAKFDSRDTQSLRGDCGASQSDGGAYAECPKLGDWFDSLPTE